MFSLHVFNALGVEISHEPSDPGSTPSAIETSVTTPSVTETSLPTPPVVATNVLTHPSLGLKLGMVVVSPSPSKQQELAPCEKSRDVDATSDSWTGTIQCPNLVL